MSSWWRRALASYRGRLVRVALMAMAGGAVVGIAWTAYVWFGLINWYPVIFHPGPGPPPSPFLVIPFLGAVAGGGVLALSPLKTSMVRVFVVGFASHGVLSVLIYGAWVVSWFETQTPAHVLFFGLGALATILGSIATNPFRLMAGALVVAAVAVAIDAAWVVGQNIDPDLYGGIVIGIAIAYWLVLVLAAATDRVRSSS